MSTTGHAEAIRIISGIRGAGLTFLTFPIHRWSKSLDQSARKHVDLASGITLSSTTDRSEAAACEKISESRISAIPIPLDVDREEHQVHVARGVGAIQPFEGGVRIAQPGMHEGERIWRDVALAGRHLQRPEQVTGFGRASGPPEDVSGQRYRLAVLA
jgi:hypothetical protein